jgi:hypothetical protein
LWGGGGGSFFCSFFFLMKKYEKRGLVFEGEGGGEGQEEGGVGGGSGATAARICFFRLFCGVCEWRAGTAGVASGRFTDGGKEGFGADDACCIGCPFVPFFFFFNPHGLFCPEAPRAARVFYLQPHITKQKREKRFSATREGRQVSSLIFSFFPLWGKIETWSAKV